MVLRRPQVPRSSVDRAAVYEGALGLERGITAWDRLARMTSKARDLTRGLLPLRVVRRAAEVNSHARLVTQPLVSTGQEVVGLPQVLGRCGNALLHDER